ncbi:4'-phosphopantetheinyl transferase superfamily protein [Flavobacterium sp.]|uniref:4'-phosphopantetheinyl transferase family protein n=1 Tax=Flavobacterium sp. TaxID=239 RepID=UPI00286D14D6|nr:4'-phosphopantetheinyl transferase superfamily protein [Flavobacterium sp.]
MPLYKTISVNPTTKILLWKITESFEEISSGMQLKEKSALRLNNMKSELHQRAFLSVRKLLHEAGYSDFDLHYDAFGKPYFDDGKHISISHSHEFSSIILSNQNVGIDLEMQRDKITAIAHKFAETESHFLNPTEKDYIQKLTVIWGAKEAIFKIRNEVGISFKDHIRIHPFEINQKQTNATLDFENKKTQYAIFFEEVENFTLVYAFEKSGQ